MSNQVTPRDAPAYWFAQGDGRLHTGVTEPGLTTISGSAEFCYGTVEDVAALLDKYKAELPTETSLGTASGTLGRQYARDDRNVVKWIDEKDERTG